LRELVRLSNSCVNAEWERLRAGLRARLFDREIDRDRDREIDARLRSAVTSGVRVRTRLRDLDGDGDDVLRLLWRLGERERRFGGGDGDLSRSSLTERDLLGERLLRLTGDLDARLALRAESPLCRGASEADRE
jgi:hypothetical protein